jgi:3-methyl-2-oxobutanoate hydroxymethyltransferase
MSSSRPEKGARASVRRLLEMKRDGVRIVAMTAYDVLSARMLEGAGVDLVLVGDSLGQVVLGYDSTIPVSLSEMIHHARAVKRGAPDTFVVLDMPFLTYHASVEDAVRNAGRALQEAGVESVKLEGGSERTLEALRAVVASGIPAMGHIGRTPQSAHALGGYGVDGAVDADRLRAEAAALEAAGAFAIVLGMLPATLAGEISRSLTIPTIGIGAGPECDGQVLLLHDALGLTRGPPPKSVKRFASLYESAAHGIREYAREVREGSFPGPEHSVEPD